MRIKATCSFKGWHYAGWQIQPHAISVQEIIQQTLKSITKSSVAVIGCSRTDAKVSAEDFVFHFDITMAIPLTNLKKVLNDRLPKDIYIYDLEVVDKSFHARRDSKAKLYRYTIETGAYNVFENEYVYQFNKPIDIRMSQQVLDIFVGTHDFTSFNTTPLSVVSNQVRTITFAKIQQVGSKAIVHVQGNGFLHHMVRMIVQTMIEVNKGNITVDDVSRMLQAKDKNVCRYKADAQGLTLERVYYESKNE